MTRVGDKTVTLQHRLLHPGNGGEAMRAVVVLALMDLRSRKAVALPEDIRETAERLLDRSA